MRESNRLSFKINIYCSYIYERKREGETPAHKVTATAFTQFVFSFALQSGQRAFDTWNYCQGYIPIHIYVYTFPIIYLCVYVYINLYIYSMFIYT